MNTPKNDGGPAFPWSPDGPNYQTYPGMSLRDWFAGQALAGIIADQEGKRAIRNAVADSDRFAPQVASVCYLLADAMLAERGGKQ